MSSFWPTGLDLSDTSTPLEVLQEARADWEESSDGTLSLMFREAESEEGADLIYVYALHAPSKRTKELLRVAHRKGQPYPLTITLGMGPLPRYLRRSVENPLSYIMGSTSSSRTSTNPWVCDTPREFRDKLAKALNQGQVVAELQSLISGSRAEESDKADSEDDNALEEEGDRLADER